MEFKATLNNYIREINSAIDSIVPSAQTRPTVLHEAMRYGMEGVSKRLRPTLLLAANSLFHSHPAPLPAAVAIECIHSYSLIHDDLPAMDDSPLRRGKPSVHIKFDESTAILAGDALLTLAFQLIPKYYGASPIIATKLSLELATAAGSQRLIGGQYEDTHPEEGDFHLEEKLYFIHANKTAALISASIQMGLILASASHQVLEAGKTLGMNLGLAFQIVDDILDETSDAGLIGKPTNQAVVHGTLSYPAIFGLEVAKQKVHEHTKMAATLAREIGGNNGFLIELIESLEHRIR